MRYLLKLLALLFLAVACKNVSEKSNTIFPEAIDNYTRQIDSLINTTQPRIFNGVILITQNGTTKYSKEFGYADFEKKIPISLEDNFRIQSNSKQITAVLALKELEKGSIELNTPIKAYLPELEQSWADTVSIHQLLNMSSGVVGMDRALLFVPGTDYRYSNAAYGLLGIIIEKVSGKAYITLANELFQSVGMKNTFCYEFGKDQNGPINAYAKTEEGFQLVDFYARGITPEGWKDFIPAGGIISNAKDLNTWDIQLHNGKILKPESYQLMTNYMITGQHAAFGEEKIGYGYGVRIDDNQNPTIIGHAGKGIGFACTKFYVPEKKLDVIVLENIYDDDPNVVYHFEKEIKDLIMRSSLVN